MTPDEMSKRLAAWAADREWQCAVTRRVVYVEAEGPRRTWVLTEGGRQVGHVRGRELLMAMLMSGDEMMCVMTWAWEASDRTREMLRLDGVPGLAQTVPEEASR